MVSLDWSHFYLLGFSLSFSDLLSYKLLRYLTVFRIGVSHIHGRLFVVGFTFYRGSFSDLLQDLILEFIPVSHFLKLVFSLLSSTPLIPWIILCDIITRLVSGFAAPPWDCNHVFKCVHRLATQSISYHCPSYLVQMNVRITEYICLYCNTINWCLHFSTI